MVALIKKEVISTKKVPSRRHYSQAIKAGNTLYLAGQVGRDAEGRLAKGDAKAQTIQALKNMKAILEEANTSMDNVVKTTVYFKRRADIMPIREGRQLYFRNKPPASTLIQIAGFSEGDILVEIDATAFVP